MLKHQRVILQHYACGQGHVSCSAQFISKLLGQTWQQMKTWRRHTAHLIELQCVQYLPPPQRTLSHLQTWQGCHEHTCPKFPNSQFSENTWIEDQSAGEVPGVSATLFWHHYQGEWSSTSMSILCIIPSPGTPVFRILERRGKIVASNPRKDIDALYTDVFITGSPK